MKATATSLRRLVTALLLAAATTSCVSHDADADADRAVLPAGATVLFQGDSITDAGRARKP